MPLGAACIIALRADSQCRRNGHAVPVLFAIEAGLSDCQLKKPGGGWQIFSPGSGSGGCDRRPGRGRFPCMCGSTRSRSGGACLKTRSRTCSFCRRTGLPLARNTGCFDWCIRGEGEEADRLLVNSWLDGAPSLPPGRIPVPLATLPSPWLDGTLDSVPIVRDGRGALWELSRGCPFSCSYCYESRGEKTVREIPLPRLEKELEYFSQKGIERIFVLDPTYNASKKRALSLLALIEQKAPDIHFNFEIRADSLTGSCASLFAYSCSCRSGFRP